MLRICIETGKKLAVCSSIVLKDAFCSGQNHVANDYKEDVYARVDADRIRISKFELSIKNEIAGMGVCVEREMEHVAGRNGYTAIQPRTYLLFQPGHSYTKYVSIFDTSGKLIAGCFPIGCNDGVMVNSHGYIVLTKNGNIWESR